MLTQLQIQNFTIVESLNIEFQRGLIALTGETGAGKSILLDALSILLGQKAPGDIIRPGTEQCNIIASFDISTNPKVKAWLKTQQITEEPELVIRRAISANGRSKSYLNGLMFPISKIKEMGEDLVHIHGQHQQYHLLRQDIQREQLDAYATLEPLLEAIKSCFDAYQKHRKMLEDLKNRLYQQDKQDLLRYQLDELSELNLTEGEFEHLIEESRAIHQGDALKTIAQDALNILSHSDNKAINHQLEQLIQIISSLPKEAANIKHLIEGALIQCQEAESELQAFFDGLELHPEKASLIEQRLDNIHRLARKHQVQAKQLYEHHQTLKLALQEIESSESQLISLEKSLEEARLNYQNDANKLSEKRAKAAQTLQKALTLSIRQLGIPEGNVAISLHKQEIIHPKGQDSIEFLVAPNPGLSAKPLAKIASGGELSRISLAIQVLTAEKKAYPTLIFDEVDTGIGGKTAANVGRLLRQLGKHTQVFCITHQAQVAAFSHGHYKVSKTIKNKQTYSAIEKLTCDEKVKEIARMMEGLTLTDKTLQHAKELVQMAE